MSASPFLITLLAVITVVVSKDLKNDEKNNPTYYKIGGVLSNNVSESDFQKAIQVSVKSSSTFFFSLGT